ncbi:MAG: M20 family metallopeptidase [Candidatus Aenigmatarchaeota archaeon]
MVDRERIVELTRKLVQVNSSNPPGNEKVVVDILAEELKKLGLEVRLLEVAHERPNLLATWRGGEGKKLIIHSHTDTIPAGDGWEHNPFGGEVENGKIYGRGAADMKGSLAAMVCAIEQLKKEGWEPNGELMILACCNEEMGDREEIGMKHVADKITGDLIVMADTSDFNIIVAEKGMLWMEFIAKGKQAHGSMPWLGVNAIEMLGRFLMELKKLEFDVEHPLLGKSTLSINMLSGGVKTNAVPGKARSTVDIRLVPGEDKDKVKERIAEIIRRMKEKDKEVDIEMKEIVYYDPVETSPDQAFVAQLKETVERVLGKEVKVMGEHGATGAGIFISHGIPAVVCGPGKPEVAHARDEYIEIDDLVKACEIYVDFAKKFLG